MQITEHTLVLASIDPPSVWDFYGAVEYAEAKKDEANAYNIKLEAHGAPKRNYQIMSAVKYNLLAQIDRSEHRDEETHLPYNEVAVLYTAYAAMGGDLNQFSSNIYDWPQWEQDLAADCKRTLEQED